MKRKTVFGAMNASANIMFILYVLLIGRFALSWMNDVSAQEISRQLELINTAGWTAFIISVLIFLESLLSINRGYPVLRSIWNFIRAFLVVGSVTAINIIERMLSGPVQINL